MKLIEKTEWLEFKGPLAEPEIEWPELRWDESYTNKEPNNYVIERIEYANGKVIWFGQGTNWVKENNSWCKLGVDKSIEPYEDGCYPAERSIMVPCKAPIYEEIYQSQKQTK